MLKQCIGLALSVVALWAASEGGNVDNDSIDAMFLQSLHEASDLAMHDKLNLEEIPSTVTVIRRDLIIDSGADTLLDVLRLVPGVCISIGISGKRQIVMRGVRSAYRDKIKLLVNGVDVTNNLYNNQFYYYNFPASLIKRVEVTKTPDAVLYGSNAFLGVINVITLDEENEGEFFGGLSDQNRYEASAFESFHAGQGVINLDLYARRSEPDIRSRQVMREDLTTGESVPFRAPMDGWTLEENQGAGLQYHAGGLHLGYRYQRYKKGSFFGIAALPPLKHDHDVVMTHQSAVVSYERYMTPEWKWHLQVEGKDYRWDGTYRTLPYDYDSDDLSTISDNPDEEAIMGAYVHEMEAKAVGYLRYHDAMHNLTFQLEGRYAKPVKMCYLQYLPAQGATPSRLNLGPEGEPLTGEYNVLKEGIDRKAGALAVEDLLTLQENFSVIGGVRYDRYNDFDGHFSYKLGAIWQPDESNTLKWLYNHTFRAPSWVELYANAALQFHGNPDLKPETMDMGEVDWLYRWTPKNRFKLNVYYGKNRDTIQKCQVSYVNGDDLELAGVEGSWEALLSGWGSMEISATYAYVEKMVHDEEKKNGRLSLRARLDATLPHAVRTFTMLEYHDGAQTELDGHIPATLRVDQTFTWRVGVWRLQAGVRNLFDTKIYHGAETSDPVLSKDGSTSFLFYPEGGKIPTIGREWFASLAVSW